MNIIITLPMNLWQNIVNGTKTCELRKQIPHKFLTKKDRCYVVIKGTSELAGYFTVSDFVTFETDHCPIKAISKMATIQPQWITKYTAGTHHFYALLIDHVVEYQPYQIASQALQIKHNPQSYIYTDKTINKPRKRIW